MMLRRSVVILSSLLVSTCIFLACANKGNGARKNKTDVILTEEAKILTAVALSDEKSLIPAQTTAISCDIKKAVELANSHLTVSLEDILNTKVDGLLGHCFELFACAKSTQEFMTQKFMNQNTKIRVGIADFKKIGLSKNDAKDGSFSIQGMYLPTTNGIYIDSNLTDGFGVCSILYHEMIHRFDDETKKQSNQLHVEYRAYHAQALFSGEFQKEAKAANLEMTTALLLHRKFLACPDGQTMYVNHSRSTLMDFVAKILSVSPDAGFAASFAPFEWEPVQGCAPIELTKTAVHSGT